MFGHRAADVIAGKDAALGDSLFKIVFINTAPGAPLPDLEQFFVAPLPGQELKSLYIYARADGTLRAAFGVADGTPGRATVTQTGLFMTHFCVPVGTTGDCFAVENIGLQVVGNGP